MVFMPKYPSTDDALVPVGIAQQMLHGAYRVARLPRFTVTTSLGQVMLPTIPDTTILFRRWNDITAVWVAGPNRPSTASR